MSNDDPLHLLTRRNLLIAPVKLSRLCAQSCASPENIYKEYELCGFIILLYTYQNNSYLILKKYILFVLRKYDITKYWVNIVIKTSMRHRGGTFLSQFR